MISTRNQDAVLVALQLDPGALVVRVNRRVGGHVDLFAEVVRAGGRERDRIRPPTATPAARGVLGGVGRRSDCQHSDHDDCPERKLSGHAAHVMEVLLVWALAEAWE